MWAQLVVMGFTKILGSTLELYPKKRRRLPPGLATHKHFLVVSLVLNRRLPLLFKLKAMATLAAAAARQAANSLRLSSARTAGQASNLIQRRGLAGAAGETLNLISFCIAWFPISFFSGFEN